MRKKSLFSLFPMIFILLNCGSSRPANFYILSSISESNQVENSYIQYENIHIGIGPAFFPEYLNRPQIVVHESRNKLIFAEFERWAQPLDENFLRIMVRNLATLLNTKNVYSYPWYSTRNMNYQIIFNIDKFELDPSGMVVLDLFWEVTSERGISRAQMKSTLKEQVQLSEKLNREDYENIVAAMSRLVEALSRKVASEFKTMIENENR